MISPQFYNKVYDQSPVLNEFRSFLKQNSVPVLDYRQEEQFIENKALFHDIRHLNDTGAPTFTRKLAEDLNTLLHY